MAKQLPLYKSPLPQANRAIPRPPMPTAGLGRPSQNLGHVMGSQLRHAHLFDRINSSNPLPFSQVRRPALPTTPSMHSSGITDFRNHIPLPGTNVRIPLQLPPTVMMSPNVAKMAQRARDVLASLTRARGR